MNKTPNKRKSLAVSNETPSKLLKVGRSPKTPKSAIKANGNKTPKTPKSAIKANGNKTLKTPNKTPKTPKSAIKANGNKTPKTPKSAIKANGNKTPKTPKSAIKAAKKVEEDVTDESEENEESIVFNSDLNQESDEANSDAEAGEDSDAEVGDESDAEVDENSDAESDNGENDNEDDDESEEENDDTDQEQDDDDEVDSTNDDKTNKKTIKFEPKNKPLTVYVRGLPKEANLEDVFSGCEISKSEPQINEYDVLLGYIVTFENIFSLEKAFTKNETEYEGHIILVQPCGFYDEYFNAYVYEIRNESKLEQLFQGCKIEKTKKAYQHPDAFLIKFADEESIQKALLKHDTEFDDCEVQVKRLNWTVRVKGLKSTQEIKKFFKDCVIASIIVEKRDDRIYPNIFVDFKDWKSLQKALSLNFSMYEAIKLVRVELKETIYKPKHRPFNNETIDKSEPKHRPFNNETIDKSEPKHRPFNNEPFNGRGKPFNNRPFNNRGRSFNNRPFNNRGRSFNNRPFNNRGRSFNNRPFNNRGRSFNNRPFNNRGRSFNKRPFNSRGRTFHNSPMY